MKSLLQVDTDTKFRHDISYLDLGITRGELYSSLLSPEIRDRTIAGACVFEAGTCLAVFLLSMELEPMKTNLC